MIGWLQPAALFGLILAVVPLLIHLLRTRRADRIAFPSIRFIRPSTTAAVRLRAPSDWSLLAVRAGIVTATVLALAQPIWLTPGRLDRWNALTARAILVDTSESMRRSTTSGRSAAAAAADAATAEQKSAAHAFRIDSDTLSRDIGRAVVWLRTAPPARRELVIVSDAQRGTLEGALSRIPPEIGVRVVEVGEEKRNATIDGFRRLGAGRLPGRSQQITLTGDATQLTSTVGVTSWGPHLQLVTAARDTADGHSLLEAVAAAGAPMPPADQGVVFEFPAHGRPSRATGAAAEPWMVKTILRLQQDEDLQRLARGAVADSSPRAAAGTTDARWTVLARDENGQAIVSAAASGDELLVVVGTPVSSFFSAAVVRATLAARQGSLASPEAEVLRTPRPTLAAWSRPPGPVDRAAWRHADRSDARWLWLVVVVLLMVEQWLRTRPVAISVERETRAAA
jgi:hypothetical protein